MISQLLKSQLIQLLALADTSGLFDAREFILDTLVPKTNTPQISNFLRTQINEAVFQTYDGPFGSSGNNKIAAIKMYRTLTGQGLKESKEYVETLVAQRDEQRRVREEYSRF